MSPAHPRTTLVVLVLGLVAVTLLLGGGPGWSGYSAEEIAAIEGEWELLAARVPAGPTPAPGTATARSFAREFEQAGPDDEERVLARFRTWLAGSGPHPLARDAPAIDSQGVFSLLEVGRTLAAEGDPQLLPGLLSLGHTLRTRGSLLDMMIGIALSDAALERLETDGLPTPADIARFAPAAEELRNVRVREALALVEHVEAGGAPGAARPLGGIQPVESLAGDLDAAARADLVLAMKRSALDGLDPSRAAPAAPARGPSTWDQLLALVFGSRKLVERELLRLTRPPMGSARTALEALTRRFDRALGRAGDSDAEGAQDSDPAPPPGG